MESELDQSQDSVSDQEIQDLEMVVEASDLEDEPSIDASAIGRALEES